MHSKEQFLVAHFPKHKKKRIFVVAIDCPQRIESPLTNLFFDSETMNHLLFLGNLGWGEILIIALVVLLLFGGRKIPELMRGIGKGVRSFKEGMKGIDGEQKQENDPDKQ